MKFIALPDNTTRRLPFYLAMEEYVARFVDGDELFFMWQVNPTVIFGRNQLINNEVNLDYCTSHNIQTYRRKSGGGCVYADMSNIMFSYIAKSENVQTTFGHYTTTVANLLQTLGVNAESNGRNDILINGRKVSGNAFYHVPGRSIVHGTMLFDTDMENMINAITPSSAKLESKGVKSVRNHITTLSEYLTMNIEEFKEYVRTHLCDGEILLSADDIRGIEEIEKDYYTEDFIYGSNPRGSLTKHQRIDGAGEFQVSVDVNSDVIKRVNIAGDFFLVGDIDNQLIKPLIGVRYNKEAVAEALKDVNVGNVIMNLDNEGLINLIF